MQYRMIFAAAMALGNVAYALPARPLMTQAPSLSAAKRQESGSGGSTVLDAPMTIAAGESFDGGNAVFDRGVSCTGQEEGGDSDAVFILEAGATLSNVRIGPNQIEGVHCNGGCNLNNVFWDAVCEDAFSIKKQADNEVTTINGGGATGAEDKVIQHNGGGTVIIKDFVVSDFGKLYRSCGNCKSMPARHVEVIGGSATDGKILVGINPNMGDTAKISGVSVTGVKEECVAFDGVTDGSEPKKVGSCDGNTGSTGGDATAPSPTEGSDSDNSEPTAVESAIPEETSDGEDSEATPIETAAPEETDSNDEGSDSDDSEATPTETAAPEETDSNDENSDDSEAVPEETDSNDEDSEPTATEDASPEETGSDDSESE